MKSILLVGLLFLAGCGGTPIKEPFEVKVPVYIPCQVVVPTVPVFAVDKLDIGSDIWDMMIALRSERQQRKQYELEILSLLNTCTKDVK